MVERGGGAGDAMWQWGVSLCRAVDGGDDAELGVDGLLGCSGDHRR